MKKHLVLKFRHGEDLEALLDLYVGEWGWELQHVTGRGDGSPALAVLAREMNRQTRRALTSLSEGSRRGQALMALVLECSAHAQEHLAAKTRVEEIEEDLLVTETALRLGGWLQEWMNFSESWDERTLRERWDERFADHSPRAEDHQRVMSMVDQAGGGSLRFIQVDIVAREALRLQEQ